MTFQPRPRSPRPAPSQPPFTFFFAAQLTVLACFIYSLIVRLVAGSLGASHFELAHALGLAGGFASAMILASLRISTPLPEVLALRAPARLAWLAPFLLLPALLLISELDNWVVLLLPAPLLPPPPADSAAPEPFGTGLLLATLAVQPLAQEFYFRGLVQGRLRTFANAIQTVIATTLLSWAFATLSVALLLLGFDSAHAIVRRSVHALGAAALLAILRQSSGSLYPSLLLAILFGVIDLLGTEHALGIPGFDDATAAHTPARWLIPAVLLTAAGFALCTHLARSRANTSRP
jgi:hypothetical protein